jgi:pyruvate,water dikinase
MLVGSLLPADGASAAGVALNSIAHGRARGWTDEDIIARSPGVLAVVTPSLGRRAPLPQVVERMEPTDVAVSSRERLRLRTRWMHELMRQVVRELASRLVRRGVLADVDAIGRLTLDDLAAAVAGDDITVADDEFRVHTPVPARFRLSASGHVVSETGGGDLSGVGASSGRTTGAVVFDEPGPGDVLVVHTLDPALAPLLAVVGGVIAETGSPLSHLAILARERHVPVVVGYEGARERFPAGSTVTLDGASGEVELVGSAEVAR